MRNYSIFFILIIISNFLFGQKELNKWSHDDYLNHDVFSFQKLKIVHQNIDEKNIDYRLLNAAIFYCTNIERRSHNLTDFIYYKKLERAAQDHSKSMVTQNFYSHKGVINAKITMKERLKFIKSGYKAENIYDFFKKDPTYWSLAKGLVDGWMNSPGHRKNILNPKLNYLGCGSFFYNNEKWPEYFWIKSTQNFSSNK